MLKKSSHDASNLILDNSTFNQNMKDASVQSQSPILSLGKIKIKYQYPGLKKIDSNFTKGNFPLIRNGSISVNKYGKLAHYNILFHQGQKHCKYKRILPLFHLNPEDSSIYKKRDILFKKKAKGNCKLSEMFFDTQNRLERKMKQFQIKNVKTGFLSAMSTDKLSLSDRFWITNGETCNDNNNHNSLPVPSKQWTVNQSIFYRKANCNLSNSCLAYVKNTIYSQNKLLKRNISEKGLQGIDSYISNALK